MKFILATAKEEAQLRAMTHSAPMPGHIQIRYEREPDFFHGLDIQGTFHQVVAAMEEGELLGFGCRSVRPMFINGRERDFGYLSGLRSSLQGKRRLGLARGYRLFKELHADQRCPGYITTIIEGNREAIATIASGRAGLPQYLDLGICETYALALKQRASFPKPGRIRVRRAQDGEEGRVIEQLRRFGSESQFFPALHVSDFGTPLLRNLPVTAFLIAEDGKEACGIAAVWDQSPFKQHRIHAYRHPLRLARPFINLGLWTRGLSPLPPAGELLRHVTLCFRAVRDHDPSISAALIDAAAASLRDRGTAYLITGFHQNDPARAAMTHRPSTCYQSRLFFVGWEQELAYYQELDSRPLSFEPAIL
jgi:hypothetical protein